MRLAALVPAHNEAATVRAVVEGALREVDACIVIDDGSTDGTAGACAGLGARVIRHDANAGKGPRLAEGLALAFAEGADAVITLDADGQHDPADIPAFRDAALAAPGALVLGDRSADMGAMPPGRARWIRFGNFFIGWAAARRIADAQCGMRLYPRAIADRGVLDLPDRDRRHFVFESAVLIRAARAGIPFATVPVPARYPDTGERQSHYRPATDGLRIAGMVTRSLLRSGLSLKGFLIACGLSR